MGFVQSLRFCKSQALHQGMFFSFLRKEPKARGACYPVFCPAFTKAGKMFPKGNVSAALPPENACTHAFACTGVGGGAPTPREMPRSGAASRFAKPRSFIARAVCCPDRDKLSMQWKASERERFYVLFASAKRTKKQTGFHPATPVQIAGRYGVLDWFSDFHHVTSYAETAILHSIDGNDLNRC